MRRGEVWTIRDGHYASKARPAVVVQSDEADGFESTIVCLITTFDSSGVPTRHRLYPDGENGLREASYVMTDKIASVSARMLGERIGRVSEADMEEIGRKLAAVLGL